MSHPTASSSAGDPFAGPSKSPAKPPELPDLPPVEAPSVGFVVQLFVIPAAVVVVVIIVWLLFGKLAGGERDPMEYVRQLRLPSANWRSAYELAREATPLAGAKLVIEEVPLVVHCSVCAADRVAPSVQQLCCPVCGAPTSEVVSGRELEVCALEIES